MSRHSPRFTEVSQVSRAKSSARLMPAAWSASPRAVDHHGTSLADAVRAIGRLILDGRVPPRVEQENVIGGGEVEPGPAGLERDQHHRRAGVVLEAAHHPSAVPGRAVEPDEIDAGLLQLRLCEIEERGPLREDQRLVPLGDDAVQRLHQQLELGRGRGRLTRNQTRVTGGLSQAQQRFEGREHAAAGLESFDDLVQRGHPYGVVHLALAPFKLAAQHHLGTRRQFRRDLLLEPP